MVKKGNVDEDSRDKSEESDTAILPAELDIATSTAESDTASHHYFT